MSVLNRYLLRRNLFLLFALLSIGAGVYVLSDLFQRIDTFMDADEDITFVALYYIFKLPLIISQILPAVFLLAVVMQLLLMAKNRESIALQSGGVSPAAMLRFVIIYGLVWSCMQFAFSQVLGVQGERLSSEMWAQDIRGRDPKNTAIKGLLFTQESYVVETKLAWPQLERAEGVTIYKITPDGKGMVASYSAETAESGPNGWVLYNVEVIEPDSFSYTRHERLEIDLRQNLDTFKTYDEDAKTSEIALPELLETIKRLEQTGTNVEGLETEFFGRFAYSGSILVMGILGLALTMRTDNIYIGVVLSLVLTFFFYAANSLFSTMGQAGSLPPLIAAWLANISFTALALLYIFSRVIMASLRRS